MSKRKVLLFIFEGVTDKISLENILQENFSNYNTEVEFIGSDITSNFNIPVSLIVTELQNIITEKIKRKYFTIDDIEKIIHVIDTDGGFIDDSKIIYSNEKDISYTEENIFTNDLESTRKRNQEKTAKVKNLFKRTYLFTKQKIPYQIFYFSRNREHVLNDLSKELNQDEKRKIAFDFAQSFLGKEKDFVTFINDKNFAVNSNFYETWNFILSDTNSLKRFSNFHLIFNKEY